MPSVKFDVEVGGDDTTVSDDNDAITGLGQGGHRSRFVPALSNLVAIAGFMKTQIAIALSRFSDVETAAVTATNKAAEVVSSAAIVESTKNQMLNAIDNHQAANNNNFDATDTLLTSQTDITALGVFSVNDDSDPSWPDRCHGLVWQTEYRVTGEQIAGEFAAPALAAAETGAIDGMYYQGTDGKYYELSGVGGTPAGTERFRFGKADWPRDYLIHANDDTFVVFDADNAPSTPFRSYDLGITGITSIKCGNGFIIVGHDDGVKILHVAEGDKTGIDVIAGSVVSDIQLGIIAGTLKNPTMPDVSIFAGYDNGISRIEPNHTLKTPVVTVATGNDYAYLALGNDYVACAVSSSVHVYRTDFDAGSTSDSRIYHINENTAPASLDATITSLDFVLVEGDEWLAISSAKGIAHVKLAPTLAECLVRYVDSAVAVPIHGAGTTLILAESSADDSALVGATPINDTFTNADLWDLAGAEAGWSIGSGEMVCDGTQVSNTDIALIDSSNLIIGETYNITANITRSSGVFRLMYKTEQLGGDTNTTGAVVRSFVCDSASPLLRMRGNASYDGAIQDYKIELAVKNHGTGTSPPVIGTVNRVPAAVGCDKFGYTGFSATDHFKSANDTQLDVGTTGDWHVGARLRMSESVNSFAGRYNGVDNGSRLVFRRNTGSFTVVVYNHPGGSPTAFNCNTLVSAADIAEVFFQRRNGFLQGFINGNLEFSIANAEDMDSLLAADFFVGGNGTGWSAATDEIYDLVAGAGSMSSEDIAHAYEAQNGLYQAGVKSLIQSGTSANRQASDYDVSTGLLHSVGNGTNAYQANAGFIVVDTYSIDDLSESSSWDKNLQRVSANRGNLLLGRAANVGGVLARQPKIDPRAAANAVRVVEPYHANNFGITKSRVSNATPKIIWSYNIPPNTDQLHVSHNAVYNEIEGTEAARYQLSWSGRRISDAAAEELYNGQDVLFETTGTMNAALYLDGNELQLISTGVEATEMDIKINGERVA